MSTDGSGVPPGSNINQNLEMEHEKLGLGFYSGVFCLVSCLESKVKVLVKLSEPVQEMLFGSAVLQGSRKTLK